MKLLLIIPFIFSSLVAMASTTSVSYEFKDTLNRPVNNGRIRNWIGINFQTNSPKKRNDFYFEGSARYFHGREDYTYSVPEFYYKNDNNMFTSKFIIGKHILNWNKYEKFWGLNHINAQRSYDLLDNKPEGLIGLSYNKKWNDNFKTSLFLSYLYVPQLNPGIKVMDGKVSSSADWYILPPSKIQMKNQIIPAEYEINNPKITDIIFQRTLGINLSYKVDKLLISAYSLYKPENKLRINARAQLDETGESSIGKVEANPIVNYHSIYGAVIGYQFNNIQNFLGLEVIDPNSKLDKELKSIDPMNEGPDRRVGKSDDFDIRPSYIAQTYLHYSATLSRDLYNISMNYIRLLSSESVQKDSFYSETSRFKNAIGFGGDYRITDQFKTMFRWYYDFDRKDNVMNSEVGWIYKNFSILLGVEILKAPENTSYWSDYRTNDSIYSKFSLMF